MVVGQFAWLLDCASVRAVRVKSAARREAAGAKRRLLTRTTRTKPVLQSGKGQTCKYIACFDPNQLAAPARPDD
jgi:hypothetical protein